MACVALLQAAPATSQPYPGITYRVEVRNDPPEHLFIARIDLFNPRIHLRVARGGTDPDGPGEWQTTLMKPSKVAAREGFVLAVNGDFFRAKNVQDAEGEKSQFRSDIWAATSGPAVTDGDAWSIPRKETPCLIVHKDGRVTIETIAHPPADAWEIVAGNTLLVKDGKPVPHENKVRHPRTVVGLDDSGKKLTILVLDGRKKGVATGMSYAELSEEMIHLGCRTALNLDGGGSSAMILREPCTGELKVLNDPSDGRERAVANVLGVVFDESELPPKQKNPTHEGPQSTRRFLHLRPQPRMR